jgi:hypothetical protein
VIRRIGFPQRPTGGGAGGGSRVVGRASAGGVYRGQRAVASTGAGDRRRPLNMARRSTVSMRDGCGNSTTRHGECRRENPYARVGIHSSRLPSGGTRSGSGCGSALPRVSARSHGPAGLVAKQEPDRGGVGDGERPISQPGRQFGPHRLGSAAGGAIGPEQDHGLRSGSAKDQVPRGAVVLWGQSNGIGPPADQARFDLTGIGPRRGADRLGSTRNEFPHEQEGGRRHDRHRQPVQPGPRRS